LSELDYPKKLLEIGDKQGAFTELYKILQTNPRNIEVWFLMAEAVDDRSKKADCYRQIIKLDPDNQLARQKLSEFINNTSGDELNKPEKPQVIPETLQPSPEGQSSSSHQRKKGYRSLEDWLIILMALFIFVICIMITIFGGQIIRNGILASLQPTPTRIVLPPTWTPQSPTMTPQLDLLYRNDPMSYIPSLYDLPLGFTVYSSNVDKNTVVVAYAIPHSESRNMEIFGVTYAVSLCNNLTDAKNLYIRMVQELQAKPTTPDTGIIDEMSGKGGTLDTDTGEDDFTYIFRIKNAVITVTVQFYMTINTSAEDFSSKLAYYAILIIKKFQ
jgi:hypothetical protein